MSTDEDALGLLRRRETAPHRAAMFSRAAKLAMEARAQGRRAALLVPDYKSVVEAKRILGVSGAFGVEAVTFEGWVTQDWELNGDGRRFVSDSRRCVLMAAAMEAAGEGFATAGRLRVAETVAARAASAGRKAASALESCPDEVGSLAPDEAAVVAAVGRYLAALDDAGLIEPSEAAALLPVQSDGGTFLVAAGYAPGDLDACQRCYLNDRGAVQIIDGRRRPVPAPRNDELESFLNLLYRADGTSPVESAGALSFAFASGLGAQDRLIADEIIARIGALGTAAVCSLDPFALAASIGPSLSAAGIELECRCSRPMLSTAAGALLARWASLGADDGLSLLAATDAALSPLSSVSEAAAYRMDARLRGNRLAGPEDALALFRDTGDVLLAEAAPLLLAGRLSEGARRFRAAVTAIGDGPERAASAAVADRLSELCDAAEEAGLGFSAVTAAMERRAVRYSYRLKPQAPARGSAIITDLREAAQLDPGSVPTVIICSLNSHERPIADREDALSILLGKLGEPVYRNPLERARAAFYDAVSAAGAAVVLERTLTVADAEPAYPAALFQEAVDCYRYRLTDDDELVQPFAVTEALLAHSRRLDETRLLYCAEGKDTQPEGFTARRSATGAITEKMAPYVVLPRSAQSAGLAGLDLSPSAIESYLECPYRWFVQRRLALRAPDEGFGPMERGTFVHSVLQTFYENLLNCGAVRVDEGNAGMAQNLMAEVFQQAVRAQFGKAPMKRFVPVNAWERLQVEEIGRKLASYVAEQPRFLPGFRPAYFEWSYGKDEPVVYGGHRLVGTVDRIDVDDRGHAVVIDYKTSLSGDYDIDSAFSEDDGFDLPEKIQTLIYGAVVERVLGLQVVGALYVNPLDGEVRGAFDGRLLGPESIPGVRPDRASVPRGEVDGFGRLLSLTETLVARKLAGLEQGCVVASPRGPRSCRWCPTPLCDRRQQ